MTDITLIPVPMQPTPDNRQLRFLGRKGARRRIAAGLLCGLLIKLAMAAGVYLLIA